MLLIGPVSLLVAQTRIVTGRVTDSLSNEIVTSGRVSVQGTTISAMIKNDGTFSMVVPVGDVTLAVRSMGFTRGDVAVPRNRNSITVVLQRDHFCTLIACRGGVLVQFDHQVTEAFRIELSTLPEDAPAHVYDCVAIDSIRPRRERLRGAAGMPVLPARPSACTTTVIRFPGFTPDRVNVRFTTATDTVVLRDVQLLYKDIFPNGPRCGVGCRAATLDLSLPLLIH